MHPPAILNRGDFASNGGSDNVYHARMARRAQHLRCSLREHVREANERTTGWIRQRQTKWCSHHFTLVIAGLRTPLSSLRLKQVEPGGTRQCRKQVEPGGTRPNNVRHISIRNSAIINARAARAVNSIRS